MISSPRRYPAVCTALATTTLTVAAALLPFGEPAASAIPQDNPAFAFSSTAPIDYLGRPSTPILDAAEIFANTFNADTATGDSIRAAVSFFRGDKKDEGVPLPTNAPGFVQFGWPAFSTQCINGTMKATATAIAVPGPAGLPLPGVPAHHTAFIFTALGTDGIDTDTPSALTVNWWNLTTGRTGSTPLQFHGINPTGPGTVNGIADTGPGRVLALISGTLPVKTNGKTSRCTFTPTIADISVT